MEPGNAARLDRGELATYYSEFENPFGRRCGYLRQTVPHTEDFTDGGEGHLRVMFEIHGSDLWRVLRISSVVLTGGMRFIEGTIDAWDWVQTPKNFNFPVDDILSADPSQGRVEAHAALLNPLHPPTEMSIAQRRTNRSCALKVVHSFSGGCGQERRSDGQSMYLLRH